MDKAPRDGSYLGHVDEPAGGWSSADAGKVNDMVERLAREHDRRHLMVRAHPKTWNKIANGLNYNGDRRKHKVAESNFDDLRQVVVTYKSERTEGSGNVR